MKGSLELQNEIEFETKLRHLLSEYGYSLRHVIDVLDPQSARGYTPVAPEKALRRARQVKQYKTQTMER